MFLIGQNLFLLDELSMLLSAVRRVKQNQEQGHHFSINLTVGWSKSNLCLFRTEVGCLKGTAAKEGLKE